MGGPLPWGASRLSHSLGIPVLWSCAEETTPPWLLGELLGQTEGLEKPGRYL